VPSRPRLATGKQLDALLAEHLQVVGERQAPAADVGGGLFWSRIARTRGPVVAGPSWSSSSQSAEIMGRGR